MHQGRGGIAERDRSLASVARTSVLRRDCVLSIASVWLLLLVSSAKENDSFPASRGAMTPFLPGDHPNPA